MLGHLLRLYKKVDATQVAVVSSSVDKNVINELDRLEWPEKNRILNPQATPEMFSSVLCGFQWDGWQSNVSHLAVALGDQPQIREKSICDLIAHSRQNPKNICQPEYESRRRHPVILPFQIVEKITSKSHTNLREALNDYKEIISTIPCDDPGLITDIDTPADYEEAFQHYFKE